MCFCKNNNKKNKWPILTSLVPIEITTRNARRQLTINHWIVRCALHAREHHSSQWAVRSRYIEKMELASIGKLIRTETNVLAIKVGVGRSGGRSDFLLLRRDHEAWCTATFYGMLFRIRADRLLQRHLKNRFSCYVWANKPRVN